MAKAEDVHYARVSTSMQKAALPLQVEELAKWGEAMGRPEASIVFSEVASGSKNDRRQYQALWDWLQAHPDPSRVTILIRDPERWARDTETALRRLREVNELGTHVLITGLNYLLGPTVDPNERLTRKMIFTFLAAVAEGGKAGEQAAREKGVEEAKEKGIGEGKAKEAYRKMKKSPFKAVATTLDSLNSGIVTQAGFARDIGFGKNTKWLRDQIKLQNEIVEEGGVELLNQWVNVWDAIRKAERTRAVGSRLAKAKTLRAKALHRVTVSYLREPWEWPNPLTEGNPMTATEGEGPGTIADALENPKRYQPK